MPTGPKKSRWGRRVFFGLTTLLVLAPLGLYLVLSSPRFMQWAIDKLNHIIPGQIVYEDLQFHLTRGGLSARHLQYLNAEGQPALSLGKMEMQFYWLSLFVGKLEIKELKINELMIDLGKFPHREGPSQWRKVLQLISKRLSIEKSFIAPARFRFKNGDELSLEELKLELTRQILGQQQIHLDVARTELNKKEKKFTSGPLSFSGAVEIPLIEEFRFFVEKAQGKLTVEDIDTPYISDASLRTRFAIDEDTILLKEGTLNSPQGTLQLDLELNSESPAFKVELRNETPIPFSAIPGAPKRVVETFDTFLLDLKADMKGKTLKELTGSIELEVEAKGNKAHDQTPDNHLTLKGKMKQGALDLSDFQITTDKMKLQATGLVDFTNQAFDAKVNAQMFDVTTLINNLADIDVRGNADVEGTVTGTFRNPNFNVKAKAHDAGYSFLNFGDIDGLFKIENGTLSFEGGFLPAPDNFTKVKIVSEEIFKKTRRTTLTSEFRNLEAGKLLISDDYQGKVSGTFNMEVSNGLESGKLQAKIENFGLYGFAFDFVEVTGEMSDNRFVLNPVRFQPKNFETLTMPSPVNFGFDDKGWTVAGTLLPGLAIDGNFLKSQPTRVNLNVALQNADLRPILAAWQLPVQESYADGRITMQLGVDGNPTSMDVMLSRFEIPLPDQGGTIKNDGEIQITLRPPRVEFKQARFVQDNSRFQISGAHVLAGTSSLALTGELALDILPLVAPQYFRDGEGRAKADLRLGGTVQDPQVTGDLTFENASLTLRPIRAQVENLNGTLKFTPNQIVFDKLRGNMREGDLIVDGEVALRNFKPTFFDLKIGTREVAISDPGVYKIIFSGDFTLKGPAGQATLAGTMDINDGVYSRNFNLTQSFLRAEAPQVKEPPSAFLKDINLDLQIRSPGELTIRNNVARIFFKSDLKVTGPALHPKVSGALTVLDGQLHYFTVVFQGATGIIDFREPQRGPFVNIELTKNYASSFTDLTAIVRIEGFTDNLQLNFSSNPPLDRRDLMALVFTGSLPGDARRNISGANLASSMVAFQLSQLVQRPLEQNAHLDIFRLEASDPNQTSAFSTLVVGKHLTDQVTLEFKTDLGVDRPLQGVQMEFLLLDNLLIKASQFNDGSFDLNLALRFLLF
jgi:hypothetical protein